MNRERTKRKLKLLNTKKPVKEKTPPEIVFDAVLTVGAYKPLQNDLKRHSGQNMKRQGDFILLAGLYNESTTKVQQNTPELHETTPHKKRGVMQVANIIKGG